MPSSSGSAGGGPATPPGNPHPPTLFAQPPTRSNSGQSTSGSGDGTGRRGSGSDGDNLGIHKGEGSSDSGVASAGHTSGYHVDDEYRQPRFSPKRGGSVRLAPIPSNNVGSMDFTSTNLDNHAGKSGGGLPGDALRDDEYYRRRRPRSRLATDTTSQVRSATGWSESEDDGDGGGVGGGVGVNHYGGSGGDRDSYLGSNNSHYRGVAESSGSMDGMGIRRSRSHQSHLTQRSLASLPPISTDPMRASSSFGGSKRRGSVAILPGPPPDMHTSRSISSHSTHSDDGVVAMTHTQTVLAEFVEGTAFNLTMILATVYALYASDLALALLPKAVDRTVYIITLLVFIAFAVEMLLFCYIRRSRYVFTFWFWLDLLALISLIPDVLLVFGFTLSGVAFLALTRPRAGRAARVGARAVRLVRIVKLFQEFKRRLEESQQRQSMNRALHVRIDTEHADVDPVVFEATKVGRKLAEKTNIKVIVAVLGMLLFFSLVDYVTGESEGPTLASMAQLAIAYRETTDDSATRELERVYKRSLKVFKTMQPPLLKLTLDGDVVLNDRKEKQTLRDNEMYTAVYDARKPHAEVVFNIKTASQYAAGLNMLLTTFVLLVMCVGSLMLLQDASKLINEVRRSRGMVDLEPARAVLGDREVLARLEERVEEHHYDHRTRIGPPPSFMTQTNSNNVFAVPT